MAPKTTKILLLAGIATIAISTPIFAYNGLGLRGVQAAPQGYGVQYAGGTYVAPQAQGYYQQQQYFAGPNVSSAYQVPQPVYQVPQPIYNVAPVQVASYAPSGLRIPAGNYTGSLGLRGSSQAFGREFNVGGTTVTTNVKHSKHMLNWQENTTGKTLTLLANRANGTLAPNSLTIGGAMKAGLMWQTTSDAGLFPILSRFPDFTARTETSSGIFVINNAALAFTGSFGDWTSFYLQPEYSETEFTGQSEFQLRKAFVVFGNLEKTPFYAAFGRKTIDFGNFDGYNTFTQTEAQHYYHAVSDQPVLELGYYNMYTGLKVTGTAFSGGRQLRLGYAGAQNENKIANFAVIL